MNTLYFRRPAAPVTHALRDSITVAADRQAGLVGLVRSVVIVLQKDEQVDGC